MFLHHGSVAKGRDVTMAQPNTTADAAAEFRAEIARLKVRVYELAPLVGLHPVHLGALLRGRKPITPDLARRIAAALTAMREGSRCVN
jgi:plasmid maintenance system antidote protein VapI